MTDETPATPHVHVHQTVGVPFGSSGESAAKTADSETPKDEKPEEVSKSTWMQFYDSETTKYWLVPLMVILIIAVMYKGLGLTIKGLKVNSVLELSMQEAGVPKPDGSLEKVASAHVMTISFWAPSELTGPYLLGSTKQGENISPAQLQKLMPEVKVLLKECGARTINEYMKVPLVRHSAACDGFIYQVDVSEEKVLAFDQKIRGMTGVQGFYRFDTLGMGRSIERRGNFYHVTFTGTYDDAGRNVARKNLLAIYKEFFHRDTGIWMEVEVINGART